MADKERRSGTELFIVDNSDQDWKVLQYLHDWCQLSEAMDVAVGYFEIGPLLALDGEWQKVDRFRFLMGNEVSQRTKRAFAGKLRHVAYAGGWKKFEPLWDWVIRARRVSATLPLLQVVLAGFGCHSSHLYPEKDDHLVQGHERCTG